MMKNHFGLTVGLQLAQKMMEPVKKDLKEKNDVSECLPETAKTEIRGREEHKGDREK